MQIISFKSSPYFQSDTRENFIIFLGVRNNNSVMVTQMREKQYLFAADVYIPNFNASKPLPLYYTIAGIQSKNRVS